MDSEGVGGHPETRLWEELYFGPLPHGRDHRSALAAKHVKSSHGAVAAARQPPLGRVQVSDRGTGPTPHFGLRNALVGAHQHSGVAMAAKRAHRGYSNRFRPPALEFGTYKAMAETRLALGKRD